MELLDGVTLKTTPNLRAQCLHTQDLPPKQGDTTASVRSIQLVQGVLLRYLMEERP